MHFEAHVGCHLTFTCDLVITLHALTSTSTSSRRRNLKLARRFVGSKRGAGGKEFSSGRMKAFAFVCLKFFTTEKNKNILDETGNMGIEQRTAHRER
jgi:hypothetical protein